MQADYWHFYVMLFWHIFLIYRGYKDYFDKWGAKLYTNRVRKILYYQIVGSMDDIQTKIINKYKKISGFVFHYLIFFVALVIGIYVFQRVLSHAATIPVFQIDDVLMIQKTKLITEFNKFLNQNIQDNDLQIQFLQWDFQTEAWFIKSVNNLILYKWFVIPRYFYMYNTIPIQPLSYFSGNTYDVAELENFVNNFVFTKKITITKSFTRVQLPLTKSLVDTFNISCLFENKFSKDTCNYYLNDFLDSFFVYTIPTDYSGLKKIFEAIKTTPTQKKRFCESLSKYFLYSNDQNDIIKTLFGACWQTYEDVFKRTTLFIEIQNTLENQSFEKISYKDVLLNEYKLLSYQQQLYQDFLVNKIDTYKVSTYLDFLQEILQNNTVDQFYKDEMYRYNNKYLSSALEKFTYQSNGFSQNIWSSKITSLLATINSLNVGDPLLWFSWLLNEIHNTSLIVQQNISKWTNTTTISQSEEIQKKLQNIPYITIEKQSVFETTIDLVAYIKFFSPDKNETIKSHIIMEYTNDMLIVKSIEFQNKPEINDVVKNLLLIQNFSIGELYSYISKNLVFYEQTNAPINATTDVCPWLQALNSIILVSCTPTMAILDQHSVRYEFTLKDGGIENVTVSDKTLENAIKTSYNTIVSNSYSLADTIQAIMAYTSPTQWHEGTTNAIVVFEHIQQYMGIKANDIADSSWTILVDISLWWINFIVNYVLKTNTLWPRYFKDILTNNKPYLIQNFNLPLDDAHQNTINSFVIDPLTAIKNSDLTARQNYNEYTKTIKN